ncbi:hypothetical protein [Klenkia brasiliensis]|uniref:Uncharacterized protein n=1 Tax=Klenkia brasiliensis TaxID=333142 RepID=A0A1G8A148_9ACTN|nr:hypothetical protein [Klenkia brasiliensis]SDH14571.1 hypothetical protein SAMN05660324_0008 [Klenkia brasiliensis]
MRPRLVVLGAALALTACTSSAPDDAPQADLPSGVLLDQVQDVDTGLALTGGTGRLLQAALDSTDTPVLLSTTDPAGQAGITRGTDLSARVTIAALGQFGGVAEMGIAADDTAVLVGDATDGPAVIRVAPDGGEQVLPVALPEALGINSLSSVSPRTVDFTPDASRVVVTSTPTDYSQGTPVATGTLQVAVVDTTTGTTTQATQVQLAQPAAVIPGTDPPVAVEDTLITADGSVLVAVGLAGQESQLLRFDPSLTPGATALYDRPDVDGTTFLAADDDGSAYLTQTGVGVQLLRVPVGGTAPEEVAVLEDGPATVGGLVVASGHAYLSGITDTELGQTVRAVDLATGDTTPAVGFCREGSNSVPALGSSGDTLLVSALCSDESTNEQHLYLFRAP